MNNTRQSIADNRVTVDFFTESYRHSATVMTYKRNLIDILGDRMTDYLDLLNVYVSRISEPGRILATYPHGSLVKKEISLILLARESETVSTGRKYVPNRATYSIFVTTPSFEVRGNFQWLKEKELNITKLMATEVQKFLPIFNGTATSTLSPDVTFQSPAILVNKAKIEILCVDSEPETVVEPVKRTVLNRLGTARVPV